MSTWFESFQFIKDPYEKLDPYKIDPKFLVWDRPDLAKAREDLNEFIKDVTNQRRVGLKVFGPIGSGKTWLTRITEKEITQKINALFLYSKIPKLEPTFQIVYRLTIDYFLRHYFEKLAKYVKDKAGTDLSAWKNVVSDKDLATCFTNYSSKTKPALARKWLIGDKLSTTELRDLGITFSLDSDYERFEMLSILFDNLSDIFSTIVLVVDELENAPVKLAGQLSDSLRDMLDTFSEKFALIASFTAQKTEEWYELGYTEHLERRLDYTIQLESLHRQTIVEFLRVHHQAYRKKEAKVDDEIFPFTTDGVTKLLEMMPPQYHYPGYFLPNCKSIARIAAAEKKPANAIFVKQNFNSVQFK